MATERPVADASVIVALLVEPERLVADHIEAAATAWAPHLLDAEVGHVLRRRVRAEILSSADGAAALADLPRLPLRRTAHDALLERAWELRDDVSFYEGLYVALAERLGVPLLTLDRRLAAAPGPRCAVQVL